MTPVMEALVRYFIKLTIKDVTKFSKSFGNLESHNGFSQTKFIFQNLEHNTIVF